VTSIRSVGFVGLGIMGKPMARNLLKAGFSLAVFSRSRPPVDELASEGAAPKDSPRACAEGQDAVITMLPDSADSEKVILGENGVLEGASPGSVVIDMSSIAPAVSRKIGAACEAKGVDFLDAPVSGGEAGAISGQLAIMAGGKKDVFARAEPIFKALGKSYVLCGGHGAGNTVKLANQIVVAANIEAVSEALVFARKAGRSPGRLRRHPRRARGSKVLEAKAPMMIVKLQPGFRLSLHQKDLANALTTAKEAAVPLP
jgi:2-hydroxy-3-oxopropionate reductase